MNIAILESERTASSAEGPKQLFTSKRNLARMVSEAVEAQFNARVATGTDGYDPVKLLKILAYTYLSGIPEIHSIRERACTDADLAGFVRDSVLRSEKLNRCRSHYFELLKRAVADVLEKTCQPASAYIAPGQLLAGGIFGRMQRQYFLDLARLKIKEHILERAEGPSVLRTGVTCRY